MATTGLVNIVGNTGNLSVPIPSAFKGVYTISMYETATSTIELAKSDKIYINGTTPALSYVLSTNLSSVDSEGNYEALKEQDIVITCSIKNNPSGVHTVPYTITFIGGTGEYPSILGLSDFGLDSLTGSFNLDYTSTISDGKLVLRVPETSDIGVNNYQYLLLTLDGDQSKVIGIKCPDYYYLNYSLTTDTNSISNGLEATITLTTNKSNGSLVPYTITGVLSTDIDVPLTGNFTISNNIGIITITSLTNEAKFLVLQLDEDTSKYTSIGLKALASIPDGNIVSLLTHNDYLDIIKFSNFSSQGDSYFTPSTALFNLISKSLVVPNTIVGAITPYCAAMDLELSIEGREINPNTSIEIKLNNRGSVLTPVYTWASSTKLSNLESAALALVSSINADTTSGYTAMYLSTIGTTSIIRISRPNYFFVDSFSVNAFAKIYTFYIDTTEVVVIPSGLISTNVIGNYLELITPPETSTGGNTTPNPYTGNTGIWTIKTVIGKYIVLKDMQLKPDLEPIAYNSYGTYKLI